MIGETDYDRWKGESDVDEEKAKGKKYGREAAKERRAEDRKDEERENQ